MAQCLQKCLQMHEKTAGEKLQEQGGGFLDIATYIQSPQVDIHINVTTRSIFTVFWIHFQHPYIWQPFDAARLCIPVCFIALKMYRSMFLLPSNMSLMQACCNNLCTDTGHTGSNYKKWCCWPVHHFRAITCHWCRHAECSNTNYIFFSPVPNIWPCELLHTASNTTASCRAHLALYAWKSW